jgi:hypothetical protein
MFYAVTLAMVIGGAMGTLILMVHLRNQRTGRWLQLERVRSSVRSAAHLAVHHQELDGAPRTLHLFEEAADTVTAVRIAFGMLDLIRTSAHVQGRIIQEEAFSGGMAPTDRVLELDGRAGPLQMAGDARISGTVRVPGGDVRRGYIEGRPFTGNRLIEGAVYRQEGRLEIVPETTRQRLMRFAAGGTVGVPTGLEPGSEDLRTERDADALVPVIRFMGPTTLSGVRMDGPVVIQCTDTLTLDADLVVRHCLVQAPYIRIRSGFAGDVQCFATRGIEVEQDVQLHYPSLLAVVRDVHRDEGAFIEVGGGSMIQGAMVILDDGVRGHAGASMRIASEALVEGEVLVEGSIQHLGVIRGMLRANELLLRTSASVYRGYLLDGILEPWPEAMGWAFGLSGEGTRRKLIDRS